MKTKISEFEGKNLEQATVENANETGGGTRKRKARFFTTGNIAIMAILTAISFVLYAFVKFPLSFMFPFWLEIQFSDLPALLGGFALGPVAGCIIIVLKCCLKMPMSTTGCVGELADIFVGIAFVLPAALIYKKNKSKKSAIVGLAVGSAAAVACSVLANWIVLVPFYAKHFFGNGDVAVGMQAIVEAVKVLYKGVTVDNFYGYYLPIAVVPFNVLRCLLCALLTYFTYKPLSKALHWEIKHKKRNENDSGVEVVAENNSEENGTCEQDNTQSESEPKSEQL